MRIWKDDFIEPKTLKDACICAGILIFILALVIGIILVGIVEWVFLSIFTLLMDAARIFSKKAQPDRP